MFWNEPNNKSHWTFSLDPEWRIYAAMARAAAAGVAAENPRLQRVLGGISPIDPAFISNMAHQRVLEQMSVVALHGFPLDWNHWQIGDWPAKLAEIAQVTSLPLWITEVGASSFGAEEVQAFGLTRSADLLLGRVDRIHWYSLFDLPRAWPATTRHREAEGSAYYRHFYMGLFDEHGKPKLAAREFTNYTPDLGVCQWFHFEDPRLDDAVKRMHELGIRFVRTGISWADSFRPRALEWFDQQMRALEDFTVTVTFCFTPETLGIEPHHASPPREPERYADFCASMVKRYG